MSSRTSEKVQGTMHSHTWRAHELRRVLHAAGCVDWPKLPWPTSDRDVQLRFADDPVTGQPSITLWWFEQS